MFRFKYYNVSFRSCYIGVYDKPMFCMLGKCIVVVFHSSNDFFSFYLARFGVCILYQHSVNNVLFFYWCNEHDVS
jgi:hypothetical protein